MVNAQEHFDKAYDNYTEALALIEEVCASDKRNAHNVEQLRRQFDVIVQYVLLKVAIADGEFSEIEGAFIDNLTDNMKILHLLGLGGDEYNWQFAGIHLHLWQIETVIDKVEKLAYAPMFDFAKKFAPVAAHTDCLDKLFGYVKTIAACFILCDGNGTQREVAAALDVVQRCLVNPWQNAAK